MEVMELSFLFRRFPDYDWIARVFKYSGNQRKRNLVVIFGIEFLNGSVCIGILNKEVLCF